MGRWCKQGKNAIRVREYYYNSKKSMKQLTDAEYYDELCKLAKGHDIRYVIVDPSAASFITTIKRHGRFMVKKADNKVLDGIRLCASLISGGNLQFCKSCTDLIREFGSYCWDNDSADDAVIKRNDHAMDDMRYFCQSIMKKVR